MESFVSWGVGLFSLAVLLFVIEILLPTGGILGLSAFAAGIGGVVAFWFHSDTLGISSLVALLVLTPIAFNFALRVIPNTPIGKMLILGNEEKDLEQAQAKHSQEMHELDGLIGLEGLAVTDLRLVGTVEIQGEAYDALSEAGVIESGSRVRVVSIQGTQVKVQSV